VEYILDRAGGVARISLAAGRTTMTFVTVIKSNIIIYSEMIIYYSTI
jgi:hypothetical protein